MRVRGFTLFELLVVLTMVGILGMAAYPNYWDYQVKVRRMEAQLALLHLANAMEQYHLNHGSYSQVNLERLCMPFKTERGYYTLVISEHTPHTYTLQAAATFQDPKCQILCLNHLGEKWSSGTETTTDCWGS